MIGIAEHYLRLHLRNPLSCHSLNRRSSPHWHKDRCLNNSMWSSQCTCSGVSVSRGDIEGEHNIRDFPKYEHLFELVEVFQQQVIEIYHLNEDLEFLF